MKLIPMISEAEISDAVQRIAQEIDRDYNNQSLVIIGVLKGAFMFLSDLVRAIKTPINRIEFIRLSSYQSATVSSNQVALKIGLDEGIIAQQNVILVEDIVDTGQSAVVALNYLQQYHPASLKLCSLLDKPERRQVPVTIDYLGLTIPNEFIVGYGMDFDEQYRELSAIYHLLVNSKENHEL